MDRYALIEPDGQVDNIITWDGKTRFEPPEGWTLRPATDDDTPRSWTLPGDGHGGTDKTDVTATLAEGLRDASTAATLTAMRAKLAALADSLTERAGPRSGPGHPGPDRAAS